MYYVRKPSGPTFNISTLVIVYRIEKKFPIYKKYIYILGQNDSDLLTNYI